MRTEGDARWLLLWQGSQLVFSERVASLEAACDRAREVARNLTSKGVKRA